MDNKYLILVNKDNKMEDKNIFQIVEVNSNYAPNRKLEERTFEAFKKLKNLALQNGFIIEIESGYRRKDYQQIVWDECVKEKGLEHTKKYVAVPGYSEHQTGLAVDFVLYENGKYYEDHKMKGHPVLKFINDNCSKYGFIIRYPKDKEMITGYGYEPWHLRYIDNINIAKYIMDNKLCLEEYLKKDKSK